MGCWTACKALRVVEHVQQVLAIELLAAYQALEFLHPLKTTAPLEKVYELLHSVLDLALPDSIAFTRREKEKELSDAENYNRRHRTKALSNLSPGDQVWVTNAKTFGTALQHHSNPRSYLVELPQGVVRRNRQHLIPLHTPAQDSSSPQQQTPKPAPMQAPISPAVVPRVSSAETSALRTRSGRTIIKPSRLNL
ncbi:hypothetical protein ABVT39_022209 [Epinephelus coioides]